MKTIFAPCLPDEDVEMGHTSAWMRIELPDLALLELQELISYLHAAPHPIVQIAARLSMVVTVFDDDARPGRITVCAGLQCGIPAAQVRPAIEPPWVLIDAYQVFFGILVEDSEHPQEPFSMLSVDVPYADLGLEVQDALPKTR